MAIAASPPSSRTARSTSSSTRRDAVPHHIAVRRLHQQGPLADRDGRAGVDATRPGSSSTSGSGAPRRCSSSSVVHCWPSQPTYWRSSSQIGHALVALARRVLHAAAAADECDHHAPGPAWCHAADRTSTGTGRQPGGVRQRARENSRVMGRCGRRCEPEPVAVIQPGGKSP